MPLSAEDQALPGKGKSVLISGGSISGPSVAWWLHKYGFQTTIVERWHELRAGGQNIDVRGVGRHIITQMGLFDTVKALNTTEQGVHFVTAAGGTIAKIPSTTNGPTAELEILRGDLAEVVYKATKNHTRYLFADCIVAVDDEVNGQANVGGKATVTFHSGRKEDFDLVIIADGIRSRTRKMIFGDEVTFRRLGLSIAYATIPRAPTDQPWFTWYTAFGARASALRPDPHGTTRACLGPTSAEGYMHKDAQERIDILRRTFAGAGWETDRILQELEESPDLYCEDVMQVKAPRYHSGRCVLLGDAGYCAAPLSGKGTTLALSGAYILAAELAKSPNDLEAAFDAYEIAMRPIVTKAKNIPLWAVRLLLPKTWWGLRIMQLVAMIAGEMAMGIMAFPWPTFVVNWYKRRESSEDIAQVPEYKELQQYW